MEELLSQFAPAYLPALARIGAVLAVAPPFAGGALPVRVRALLAMALTLGLMPLATISQPPRDLSQFIVVMISEVMIGLAMGMSLGLVFMAAQWAGEMITQQMGLSLAEVYDPAAGDGQSGAIGQTYRLLAVVVFLGADGHHALLRGIGASFTTLPLGATAKGQAIAPMLVSLLTSATGLAIQLAAPVFATMLIVDMAIGMVGRTLPQVGSMTVAVTIRSAAGLVVLMAGMVLTASVLQGQTVQWTQLVQSSLSSLGGR
jgi:flagellar biosynthetic protein FliR